AAREADEGGSDVEGRAEPGPVQDASEEAKYAVRVADLKDRIDVHRRTTERRFWRQFFSSAGATALAGMYALLDRSPPSVMLTVGFLLVTLALYRWHRRARAQTDDLETELVALLEGDDGEDQEGGEKE
ncbi:MAG TPA: hypothetical protein VLL48_13900, partial [Longimicrobiales bacterium]|nr:hypothetical protein [Longimicrobiales bacterium]